MNSRFRRNFRRVCSIMNNSRNIGRYIDIILLGWDEKSEMIR